MKVGPKYKIARRLGSAVFEKTQTAKFTLSEQKKARRFNRPRSNYGIQLIEKQRVVYSYGISNKQLGNYIKDIVESNSKTPAEDLFYKLETRLDTVILRSGMAKSRYAARQAASHGHFLVNGKKSTIPSMHIKESDVITLKDSKKDSPLYADYSERFADVNTPSWIKADPKDFSIKLTGAPVYDKTQLPFDLLEVIQFFKR